jgi:hypothetical protein
MAIGSLATAVAYRGADGERFSPTNHFVSELGELAQSELARTFNLSVIAGGLCFVVFMTGLAASRPGWLRVAAGGVGIVAGVAGSFVGVFPMDNIGRHTRAAMTFFNLAAAGGRRFGNRRGLHRLSPRGPNEHDTRRCTGWPGDPPRCLGAADARVDDDHWDRRLGDARRRRVAASGR